MKLYIVIGHVEYENTDILGIYNSEELAISRQNEASQSWFNYDKVFIKEVELNSAINDL